jgi:hypothetical protein
MELDSTPLPARTRYRRLKYCTGPDGKPRIIHVQKFNPYTRETLKSFRPPYSRYVATFLLSPRLGAQLGSKMVVEVRRILTLYFNLLSSCTDSFQTGQENGQARH